MRWCIHCDARGQVPTSVMLNWEMEFKKFCPAFKLLTYYGNAKERKLKRQGWSKPNSFHVCITSYTLILADAKARPHPPACSPCSAVSQPALP